MFSIDTCLLSKNNFYHIRIIRILNKLVADQSIHERIVRLQGLNILTKYIS